MPNAEFYILWHVGHFCDYNFHDFSSDLHFPPFEQVRDAELRPLLSSLTRFDECDSEEEDYPFWADAEIALATMRFTLRERCCERFLEGHKDLPITRRDYYLSKFGQFLDIILHDLFGGKPCSEMDSCTWAEYYGPEWQERVLSEVGKIPLGLDGKLAEFQWEQFVRDCRSRDMPVMLEGLSDYAPREPSVRGAASGEPAAQELTSSHKKTARGRPSLPLERKLEVLTMKALGKSNKECAKKLYDVKYPSEEQKSSVPTILRTWVKKATQPDELRKLLADDPEVADYVKRKGWWNPPLASCDTRVE